MGATGNSESEGSVVGWLGIYRTVLDAIEPSKKGVTLSLSETCPIHNLDIVVGSAESAT